jgi:alpha-tubulin suppressor-like RCC1 family protein
MKNFNPSLLTREKVAIVKHIIETKYHNQNLIKETKRRSVEQNIPSRYKEMKNDHHNIVEFLSIATVGKGSTGEVRIVLEKSSNKVYAIKIMCFTFEQRGIY